MEVPDKIYVHVKGDKVTNTCYELSLKAQKGG